MPLGICCHVPWVLPFKVHHLLNVRAFHRFSEHWTVVGLDGPRNPPYRLGWTVVSTPCETEAKIPVHGGIRDGLRRRHCGRQHG